MKKAVSFVLMNKDKVKTMGKRTRLTVGDDSNVERESLANERARGKQKIDDDVNTPKVKNHIWKRPRRVDKGLLASSGGTH